MKEIHKELNLGDAEDGDLVKIEEEDDEVANGAFEVMAYWHPGIKKKQTLKGLLFSLGYVITTCGKIDIRKELKVIIK